MIRIRTDVLLAAAFIMASWVPILSTTFGSLAPKMFFLVWFALTWGQNLTVCLRSRYGANVLLSFVIFLSVCLVYMRLTADVNSAYHASRVSMLKGYIWTFCFWLILHYYLAIGHYRALRQLSGFFIGSFVVTAIMTLFGFVEHGDSIVRTMVMAAAAQDTNLDVAMDVYTASRAGVGTFSHIYAMAFMIVPFLYSVGHVIKYWKNVYVACAVLLTVCVVKASFLTAVMALILALLVLVSVKQRALPAVVVWGSGLLLVVLLVILSPYMLLPLVSVAEQWTWVSSNLVYMEKVQMIRDVLATRSYLEISRFQTVVWSWDAFLERPFFGNGYADVGGGHSEVFDNLARFGVIGSVPLVAFLYWLNKYLNFHIYKLHRDYQQLKLTLMLPFILVTIFNPLGGGPAWGVLLFFVPTLPLFYKKFDALIQNRTHMSHNFGVSRSIQRFGVRI